MIVTQSSQDTSLLSWAPEIIMYTTTEWSLADPPDFNLYPYIPFLYAISLTAIYEPIV
jgi:hypothetical protein